MNQQNDPQYINNNVLPTSPLAIVSLVAGILGFTIFPVVATAVAIITGYMARKETRAVPPTAAGDGLATAAVIKEGIDRLLQHPLFVTDDDLGGI